jgi:hypothetical protein
MDVDNLKDSMRALRAPAGSCAEPGVPLDNLVAVLKTADEKQMLMLRRMRVLFAVGTALFAVALVAAAIGAVEERLLQMGVMLGMYLLVTVLCVVGIRKHARVNYGVPACEFIKQAERRYRFMRPSDWVIQIVGLGIVGAASGVAFVPYLSRVFGFGDSTSPMWFFFALFFLGVAVMGEYFTWKNWSRDRAPVWRRIRQVQQGLEEA